MLNHVLRRPGRHVAGGLLACVAALALATPAVADVDTYVPGGLTVVEEPSSPLKGGATPQTATSSYKNRECSTPFIPVAAAPAG